MIDYRQNAMEAVQAIHVEDIVRISQITTHTIDYTINVFGTALANSQTMYILAVRPFINEFIGKVKDCGTFDDLPDDAYDIVLAKSWQGYKGMIIAFRRAGITS